MLILLLIAPTRSNSATHLTIRVAKGAIAVGGANVKLMGLVFVIIFTLAKIAQLNKIVFQISLSLVAQFPQK